MGLHFQYLSPPTVDMREVKGKGGIGDRITSGKSNENDGVVGEWKERVMMRSDWLTIVTFWLVSE